MQILVVLGYKLVKINDEISIHPILKARLDMVFDFFTKFFNKEDIIICLGGDVIRCGISESMMMKKYLVEKGISTNNILLEIESLNTIENIKYLKNLVIGSFKTNEEPRQQNNIVPNATKNSAHYKCSKMIIVTSDFHLKRVKYLTKHAFDDINVPIHYFSSVTPVDNKTYSDLMDHEKQSLQKLYKNKVKF